MEWCFFKSTTISKSVEITNNTFEFLITDFDFTKNCNQKKHLMRGVFVCY